MSLILAALVPLAAVAGFLLAATLVFGAREDAFRAGYRAGIRAASLALSRITSGLSGPEGGPERQEHTQ